MIDRISINRLKSIKEMEIECKRLNLITGVNSSGKSTFLQAIMLFAQNAISEEGFNGKYLSLGEFHELLNHYSGKDASIELKIWGDGKLQPSSVIFVPSDQENNDYEVKVQIDGFSDENFLLESVMGEIPSTQYGYALDEESIFYLSCNRIGARDLYQKNLKKETVIGVDGEYALSYLLNNLDRVLDEKLVIGHNTTNTLFSQVDYWLNQIMGASLHIEDIHKSNYLQVTYNNNPKNNNAYAMYSRPTNIGSGISYIISILIACLGADNEKIIIIENPEIHLHPKAQARLCEFFYFICKSGRQLFIETHSDHIFNGIRAGIADGSMKSEDIAIDFFALDENYHTCCNPIEIGEFGNVIGTNPAMTLDDLFDQFDIDVERMIYGRY